MRKPELLAPAGNLEKLKMAIIYGADAVYMGGEAFGLRANADNFNKEQMIEGIKFAHDRGKKVYVAANIIPHNSDLEDFPKYVNELNQIGIDAIIVSDPGILSIVKEIAPNMEVHLSTQANNTNYKSAAFWHNFGVKRVILARELSFDEIKEIREKSPQSLELEAFVHGAMCISYSGRCLLSNYMTNRDANRGKCAHPCRWKYHLMEEKRPGEYMPVFENERGTFIYNSKDLCLIEHIPELIDSGLESFKIEGRIKSSYYVATVVKAYRQEIDKYYNDPKNYKFNPEVLEEIKKASHRDYTTGFFYEKPSGEEQLYDNISYMRTYDFVGIVLDYDKESNIATIEQRNRMFINDEIEIMTPTSIFKQKINFIIDENGQSIEVAPHAQMIIKIPMDNEVVAYSIIRKMV